MSSRKRGLGRGLDALLASANQAAERVDRPPQDDAAQPDAKDGSLRNIPVDLIQRGKYQPRRDIEPESLEELADSIRAQGLMQPIVIRPVSDKRYEIIAGERRWRAAQLAGLDAIPALVREVADDAAIAMALIENIQREDLNPVEEAAALQRLQNEFELTQQQVAEAVGKSRSTVANLLRLMSLQPDVRRLLEHGDLDMGHARCLLALTGDAQSQAARSVVARGLSVRQTEALVRQLQSKAETEPAPTPKQDPDIRRLQDDLSERLGTPVRIQHGSGGKGRLVLTYSSLDELDGILGHIK
jgi:ParB family chromosome partitioning protein